MTILYLTALVGICGCAFSAGPTVYSGRSAIPFAARDIGKPPAHFTTALTGGGPAPAWIVRGDATSPTGQPVVLQESKDDTSYRFPLCIYDDFTAADVSATVKLKPISGTVDQAGGIVLRYTPENYYVARVNALEDNVNLFKTVNGNRLKMAEVETKVTPNQWHELTFTAVGKHLLVIFDGKTVIETDDATFAVPGKIGLWTKADSVTAFTDLRIVPAK